MFKGYLTNSVALITAIWAVVGYFLGHVDANQTGAMILAALGTYGIRRALPH